MTNEAAQVFEQHVRDLPHDQRLRLLAMIAEDLANESDRAGDGPLHSLAELHGLGKGLWEGVDAQEYVNSLRDEWDERAP